MCNKKNNLLCFFQRSDVYTFKRIQCFFSCPFQTAIHFFEFKSQQLKGETIFDFDLLVILLSFMHYWCWNWHWCWYTCNFDCLIFVWHTIYVCRRFLPLITFTFLSNWVNLLFNLVHRGQLCSCSSGRKTQDTRKKKFMFLENAFHSSKRPLSQFEAISV